MQKKILFISEANLKEQSIVEQNVDPKVLSKIIKTVQELKLKPVLGAALYNALVDAVYDKEKNSVALSSLHAELLVDYIQPYLVFATLADFHVLNNYKLTNKGTMKLNDNQAQSAQAGEIEYAKDYYDNYASQYKQNLIDFLKANNLLVEGADTDTKSSAIGWFLEGPRNPFFQTSLHGQTTSGEVDPVWNAAKNNYYTKTEVNTLLAGVSVGSVAWSAITGKPSTFAPSAHTHTISEVTGLQSALNAKITMSDLTWTNITGKPSLYTSAQVDTLLGTKANTVHSHFISEITGLQATLDGKQAAGNYVPAIRTITINGVSYDLTANRSWTISGSGGTSQTLQDTIDLGNIISSNYIQTDTYYLSIGDVEKNSGGSVLTLGGDEGMMTVGMNGVDECFVFSAGNIYIKDFLNPTHGTMLSVGGMTGSWTLNLPNKSGTVATLSDIAWGNIASKPTTVDGYGITDAPIIAASGSVTNVSELIIDMTSYYNQYDTIEVQFSAIQLQYGGNDFAVQMSGDGTTFDTTSGDYFWSSMWEGSASNGYIRLVNYMSGATNRASSGHVRINSPKSNSIYPTVIGQFADADQNGNTSLAPVSGEWKQASYTKALKFFATSGNIAYARYKVIGYK